MNPSSIVTLLNESQLLYGHALSSNQHTVPAFLSSWVAWEALRTRFIRVIIHHMGWTLKDADTVLAKRKISSMSAAEAVISSLGAKSPHHWPNKSAKGWKILVEVEPLRHRLIHGFKSVEPARVHAATKLVISLSLNHEWLSSVPVMFDQNGKAVNVAGSLLARRRTTKELHSRDIQELASTIGVNLDQGTKSLPSIDRIEEMMRAFAA